MHKNGVQFVVRTITEMLMLIINNSLEIHPEMPE